MNWLRRATWLRCLGLVTLLALAQEATAHDDDGDEVEQALRGFKARGVSKPIVETHIHFWKVTRRGGVPYPPPANTTLYRDILPPEYKQLATRNGVVTSGIVEASPFVEDNQFILDLVRKDPLAKRYQSSIRITISADS